MSSGMAQPVFFGTGPMAQPVIIGTGPMARPIFMAGCFPKSALVHVSSNRLVPIESIQVGDILRSWDITQERPQSTVVTYIHHHLAPSLIRINGSFEVSSSQPLLTLENSDELTISIPHWVLAQDIALGNLILGLGGEPIAVRSKEINAIDNGIEVMNLSTYQ